MRAMEENSDSSEDELTLAEIRERLHGPTTTKTVSSDSLSELHSLTKIFGYSSNFACASTKMSSARQLLIKFVRKFDGYVGENNSNHLLLSFPISGIRTSQDFQTNPKSGSLLMVIELFTNEWTEITSSLKFSWTKSIYLAVSQKWHLISSSGEYPHVDNSGCFVDNLINTIEGWTAFASNLYSFLRWLVPTCEQGQLDGSSSRIELTRPNSFWVLINDSTAFLGHKHIAFSIALQINKAEIDWGRQPRLLVELQDVFRLGNSWKTRRSVDPLQNKRFEFQQFGSVQKVCQLVQYFTDLASTDFVDFWKKMSRFGKLGSGSCLLKQSSSGSVDEGSYEQPQRLQQGLDDSAPFSYVENIDYLRRHVIPLGGTVVWDGHVAKIRFAKNIGNRFPQLVETMDLKRHVHGIAAYHALFFQVGGASAYLQGVVSGAVFPKFTLWIERLQHCLEIQNFVAALLSSLLNAARSFSPAPTIKISKLPNSVSVKCTFSHISRTVCVLAEVRLVEAKHLNYNAVNLEIKRQSYTVHTSVLGAKFSSFKKDLEFVVKTFETTLHSAIIMVKKGKVSEESVRKPPNQKSETETRCGKRPKKVLLPESMLRNLSTLKLLSNVPENLVDLKAFIYAWKPCGFVVANQLDQPHSSNFCCCMYFRESVEWNQVEVFVGGSGPHIFQSESLLFASGAVFVAVQLVRITSEDFHCLIETLCCRDSESGTNWEAYAQSLPDLSQLLSWATNIIQGVQAFEPFRPVKPEVDSSKISVVGIEPDVEAKLLPSSFSEQSAIGDPSVGLRADLLIESMMTDDGDFDVKPDIKSELSSDNDLL